MKNIKAIILMLLTSVICFTYFSVYAETNTLKAGILNDYSFDGNSISEYAEDSVNTILDTTASTNFIANEINFDDTTFNKGISDLQSGNIDFLCMVPVSDAFLAYVDYTSSPIATGFLGLYTTDYKQLYFEEFDTFNQIKIGLLKNSYIEKILSDFSTANNFTYIPVYYDTVDDMLSAVKNNSIDAIFTPTTNNPDGLKLIAKGGKLDYYCAVKKGNTNLLTKLNSAINQYKIQNPFYLSMEYTKLFKRPYSNSIGYTKEEQTAKENHPKLRILAPDNNYPSSYYDKDTGEYNGIYEDIIKKVADNAGFEIEFISYDQSEMSMNGIVMGKADIILTVSGSKQGLTTATLPYTKVSYLPLVKKDTNIFEDSEIHVGILADDSWITDYLDDKYKQWSVEKYSSIDSLLTAVENDTVSAVLVSSTDLQTKTSLIAHPKLSILQDFDVEVPASLGVSNLTCNQHIVSLLNKTIQNVTLTNSELERKVYTLNHIYVPTVKDMLKTNKQWIFIILLVIIAIIVFIKWREYYYKKLLHTDTLTQIPNKQYFMKTAEKILDNNSDKSYLLTSLDARNFKLINERFGHIVGDQTLMNIAKNIKSKFHKNGLYARSQGDSFLILVEDTSQNRELLKSLVDLDISIHNTTNYKVPLKIGVCPIPRYNPALSLSLYIDRANIAKKYTSARNTNYICYFTDDMNKKLNMKNMIESEMVRALSKGEFVVYYQPKYELANDTIIGAEALVRWNHKEKGIISPGVFIPVFERNGFIVDLDFYVYEQVLKMQKHRLDMGKKVIPISMNVSRCHLSDTNFVDKLEAVVAKYKVPKQYIEMEITESIFSQEDSSAIALIYNLKEHGFTISMDDFGSGYSSLNLLRKVQIDTLKIDKVFIDSTEDVQRSQVIVEEIINMASKIHVKTICEGVETQSQRDFLKNAGCNMVQGYFYSKPLPYEDFSDLLNSSK